MPPTRVLAVLGVVLVMLAAGVLAQPHGLVRPHAVLADPQPPPPAAAAALPAADLPWPASGNVSCEAACRLAVPDGTAGELWVAWDGARTPGFLAALDGAMGTPAFDAVRLGPVVGGEEVRLWGRGDARLVVAGLARGVPDLAALVPANLGDPLGPDRGHGAPSRAAPGCLEEEAAAGLRACLRFTTGVANVGDTPLALSSQDRVGEARMTQSLPGGDRAVGLAAYHPSHGHFHYARFVAFDLYAHDPAAGLRGTPVATSAKTGFCMVDFGKVEAAPATHPKTFWRDGCAPGRDELAMGINPGWYDIYRWFLPEQALDPTGLPDGTYELVATVDPAGTLAEGHPLDNKASVVFEWRDGSATVLSGHGLYHLVPQPS